MLQNSTFWLSPSFAFETIFDVKTLILCENNKWPKLIQAHRASKRLKNTKRVKNEGLVLHFENSTVCWKIPIFQKCFKIQHFDSHLASLSRPFSTWKRWFCAKTISDPNSAKRIGHLKGWKLQKARVWQIQQSFWSQVENIGNLHQKWVFEHLAPQMVSLSL